jgi:hypothetical protein
MSADLDAGFAALLKVIGTPDAMSATHVAPFFYWVHSPSDTLRLKRSLHRPIASLTAAGYRPEVVSLSKLVWATIDRSGRYQDWLDVEADADADDMRRAVKEVLRSPDSESSTSQLACLAESLAPYVSRTGPGRIVLVTDVGLVHPWFRLRTLEEHLHSHIRVPTVFLYPGRRSGSAASSCRRSTRAPSQSARTP